MSLFLETMTDAGRDLVACVRDMKTKEQIVEVIERYKAAALADLRGQPVLSSADQYAFACALAAFPFWTSRVRAMHWEAAACTAIRVGAYAEALAALEQAEQHGRSKERQERIRLIRAALAPRSARPTTSGKKKRGQL